MNFLRRYCKLCVARDESRNGNVELNEFCAMVMSTTSSQVDDPDVCCKVLYEHMPTTPLICRVLDPYLSKPPTGDVLGLRTWESGLVLTEYLCDTRNHPRLSTPPFNVLLEIGTGVGLPGLTACCVLSPHMKIVLSDFSPAVIANLARTVALNPVLDAALVKQGRLELRQFDWLQDSYQQLLPHGMADKDANIILLASDCLYDPLDIPKFVQFLKSFATRPSGVLTKVIFANSIRNEATFTSFQSACGEIGLMFKKLEPSQPYFYEPCVHMLNVNWKRTDVRLFELVMCGGLSHDNNGC